MGPPPASPDDGRRADGPDGADSDRDGWGWAGVTDAASSVFRTHFGIDARALAAFRIGLGSVLLLDTLLRARHLAAFYTDAGVLPRTAMADLYPTVVELSIHARFGSAEGQAVLFALTAVAAVCLLVGYRTRLATLGSLVLVLSVQGRNPLVLNGGDVLLRHLLFWGLLLPLSERWAVDATRRSRGPRGRLARLATAGLLCQVLVVYGVNAVLKHRSGAWGEATAMQYVFSLDRYTVFLGDVLAEFPALLWLGGRLWVWLLTGSWLLVVLRGRPRAILAGAFVAAHLAMALTMSLDVFPLVSAVALLPFFPASVWDRVERWIGGPSDAIVARLHATSLPGPTLGRAVPSWHGRSGSRLASWVVPAVAGTALVVVLAYNAGTVVEGGFGPPGASDAIDGDPHWDMFAPHPPRTQSWFVVAGTLESGERVDALRSGSLSRDRPPDLAATYPSARWRKYFDHVARPDETGVLGPHLADYLCARWDERRDGDLVTVAIAHVTRPVTLDGPTQTERRTLGRYDCPARR